MTTNTTKLFQLAQLAEAAYANLIPGNSLIDELQNNSFSPRRAYPLAVRRMKEIHV